MHDLGVSGVFVNHGAWYLYRWRRPESERLRENDGDLAFACAGRGASHPVHLPAALSRQLQSCGALAQTAWRRFHLSPIRQAGKSLSGVRGSPRFDYGQADDTNKNLLLRAARGNHAVAGARQPRSRRFRRAAALPFHRAHCRPPSGTLGDVDLASAGNPPALCRRAGIERTHLNGRSEARRRQAIRRGPPYR